MSPSVETIAAASPAMSSAIHEAAPGERALPLVTTAAGSQSATMVSISAAASSGLSGTGIAPARTAP